MKSFMSFLLIMLCLENINAQTDSMPPAKPALSAEIITLSGTVLYPHTNSTVSRDPERNKPKEEHVYLVLFRKWESIMEYGNGMAFKKDAWKYHSVTFLTLKETISFLNAGHRIWRSKGVSLDVSLNEEELIGIYNLTTAQKLNYELKTDHKVVEKHIKVEKEEWNDRQYIIKQE